VPQRDTNWPKMKSRKFRWRRAPKGVPVDGMPEVGRMGWEAKG